MRLSFLVDCHYVDDYIDSFDTGNKATAVAKKVISKHQEAGFNPRGFVSNSDEPDEFRFKCTFNYVPKSIQDRSSINKTRRFESNDTNF